MDSARANIDLRTLLALFADELAPLVAERVAVHVTPPAPAPAPLLDKRELARSLSISVASVDRLDRDGQPHVRIGDVKRYDLAAVLAWHRERSQSAPARSTPPALPTLSSPEVRDPIGLSGVKLLSRSKARRSR